MMSNAPKETTISRSTTAIAQLRLNRAGWVIAVIALALLFLSPQTASAATCQDGLQATGAVYRICMPPAWNGNLVVWAHGYVDPQEPVGIPEGQLTLPDGTSLPDIVTELDFAFATTSYRDNGLVVPFGVADIVDLVGLFSAIHGSPNTTYLIGASEGGLITALAVEQRPDIFDGGIAACGPVADFRSQVDHFGDFRVLFDYFFPGILPAGGPEVPQEVIDSWDTVFEPAIVAAIQSDSSAIQQLMAVSGAPFDPTDLTTVVETVRGLLWYNVHSTNDGIAKLGGNPYDNSSRIYHGSNNDWLLNWGVQRFQADPAALAEIEANYQTSGALTVPLITLHTTGDPIVPYWHEIGYEWKTQAAGSSFLHVNIPIERYGHCNFEADEALYSLFILLILDTIF
jgi:pimeloyl-ACP methyl ester carboxylesterase